MLSQQRDLAAKHMPKPNNEVQQRLKELQQAGMHNPIMRRSMSEGNSMRGYVPEYAGYPEVYTNKLDLDASIRQMINRSGRRGNLPRFNFQLRMHLLC